MKQFDHTNRNTWPPAGESVVIRFILLNESEEPEYKDTVAVLEDRGKADPKFKVYLENGQRIRMDAYRVHSWQNKYEWALENNKHYEQVHPELHK